MWIVELTQLRDVELRRGGPGRPQLVAADAHARARVPPRRRAVGRPARPA
jgi:hypothetical protein